MSTYLRDTRLDYSFTREKTEPIVCKGINKSTYLSKEEKRLYVLNTEDSLSYSVSKELSKFFGAAADDVFLFLDSIMKVSDQDELIERLNQYNIKQDDILEEESNGQIEIITAEEENDQTNDISMEENSTTEPKPEPKAKPRPPQKPPEKRDSGLIDPEDFFFGEIEDYVPYTSSDGNGDTPNKPIKLRRKKSVAERKNFTQRKTFSR